MAIEKEKAVNLLNQTGFPFQYDCANRIRKVKAKFKWGEQEYHLAMEVPYTHPKTNGPIIGLHSTIDMIAMQNVSEGNRDAIILFVIECKKASSKIKNWLFLGEDDNEIKRTSFICSELEKGWKEKLGVTRDIIFPKLGYDNCSNFDYCINGFETNSELTQINRNMEDNIYKPLKQAVQGCYAIENRYPKLIEGLTEYFRELKFKYFLYMPVVLTTANLYKINADYSKITDGEISIDAVNIGEPRKWLTYEFPLPDYLSYEAKGNRVIERRTVFIVNDKYIEEYFSNVYSIYGINENIKL
jgi:hypothetical protein